MKFFYFRKRKPAVYPLVGGGSGNRYVIGAVSVALSHTPHTRHDYAAQMVERTKPADIQNTLKVLQKTPNARMADDSPMKTHLFKPILSPIRPWKCSHTSASVSTVPPGDYDTLKVN